MLQILPLSGYDAWLGTKADISHDEPMALLLPYPAEELEVSRVGPSVNSPRNAGPECLVPA